MKNTIFFALFLVCAFTSYLPSATAASVYDTDGNILQKGRTYFVLAATRGNGGGIEFAATGNDTCPLTVVQSPSGDSIGFPIRFSYPFIETLDDILEGFGLEIRFAYRPPCSPSSIATTKWTIVNDAVKLTKTSSSIIPGFFYIWGASPNSKDYKLEFCDLDNIKCGDVGIHTDDDGSRRLVITQNDPLLVHFQNTRSSSA